MAADTLPTKKELEQLYHKKGKEAVVWYAWRHALRVLPALGSVPLDKVWKEETVKHIYNIGRVHLFLTANIAGQSKPDTTRAATARAATAAARAVYTSARAAAAATARATAAAVADDAVYARAAYAKTARARVDAAAYAAARVDYDFLINNTQPIKTLIFSRSLWSKDEFGKKIN